MNDSYENYGHWGGWHRARRGDISPLILKTLADGPAHGYEIIKRIEDRTKGMWKPSPGSVYPTLQMLEEQGLVKSRDEDGKKVYELTKEGKAQAKTEKDYHDWEKLGKSDFAELKMLAAQTVGLTKQVIKVRGPAEIKKILIETNAKLEKLLKAKD